MATPQQQSALPPPQQQQNSQQAQVIETGKDKKHFFILFSFFNHLARL
jgi:hypothetical protein